MIPRFVAKQHALPLAGGLTTLIILMAWQWPALWQYLALGIPFGAQENATFSPDFRGGDHMQLFYLGWKTKQAWLQGLPFATSDSFNFVSRDSVFYDGHLGVQFWLLALAGLVFGDVVGYNLVVNFLPAMVAFTGAYYLCHRLSPYRFLSSLLALAYAMYPAHYLQSFGGHSSGLLFAFLPWYWGAVIHHHQQSATSRLAYLAGLLLFVLAISEEHLGYHTMLASFVVFLWWGLQAASASPAGFVAGGLAFLWRWRGLQLGVLAVVAYGIGVHALLYSEGSPERFVRSSVEIRNYSKGIRQFFAHARSDVNIGRFLLWVLPFALLGLSVAGGRRQSLAPWRHWGLAFVVAFLASAILMTGLGDDELQALGLYELARAYLPYFALQRVPIKMLHTTAVLLLAAVAVFLPQLISLPTPSQRWRRWLLHGFRGFCCLLVVAQIADYLRLWGRRQPEVMALSREASGDYAALATYLAAASITLTIPLSEPTAPAATFQQYLAYLSERKMAGGYHGAAPQSFLDALPSLTAIGADGQPTPDFFDSCRKRGYTHVLVLKKELPPPMQALSFAATRGFERLVQHPLYDLYALNLEF